eukprot:CAMPEP_0117447514 /NCGR_PEP_ID=MMETSP0759-20121206/6917_1 /TAXON_ID=63605 /ORGANISM="Percolomonas cosmopolitus, Strain WS" /LENGTH=382 /DNA_ID=CAMNT_0005239857 /DNA_START=79 /DNA_END=1227 /DNA_ORIENTATION=-
MKQKNGATEETNKRKTQQPSHVDESSTKHIERDNVAPTKPGNESIQKAIGKHQNSRQDGKESPSQNNNKARVEASTTSARSQNQSKVDVTPTDKEKPPSLDNTSRSDDQESPSSAASFSPPPSPSLAQNVQRKTSLYDVVRTKQSEMKTNSFDSSKDMRVRLELIRGKDFPKCDIGPLAKSDPFCIVSLWNKQKKRGKISRGVEMSRSKVHKKTLNPQFNETLEFTIKGYKTSYILIIDVVDWNKIGSGTEMGSIVVDLQNMESNKVYKFTEALGVPFGKKKVLKDGAILEFNVTLLSFGSDDRQYLLMDHVGKMIRKGYYLKKRKRRPKEPPQEDPSTFVCGIDGNLPWKPWELQQHNIQVGVFHSWAERRKRKQEILQGT